MSEAKLTITPLGGLGEIGLNCQLWETSRGVVMVDCGLMFPSDEHLGVDVLIPHFGAVKAVKDNLLGIVLTHGHEDHIGALPWIVPELRGTTIYGSPFTLALVEHKLKERGLSDCVSLRPVQPEEMVTLGDMTFHFFPVCHSIPQGYALGVETPVGRIVLTGDFKIDPHPLAGSGTDIKLFRRFAGRKGVKLLMSDSTNVEREGRSLTEREVQNSLDKVFAQAPGRIVITLFSSHIQRIQEVFDLAEKYGRTVVISGRSLANNIEMAQENGLIKVPENFYNAYAGVPDIPLEKTVLIVTGAQGEPMSALSRMAYGAHRQLAIEKGDTVVMSSRVIPGNGRAVSNLINEMYHQGAEVLYESVRAIHASGHAQQSELKAMIKAVHPEYFVPVHGEYRHLIKHGRLAEECGVEKDKIIVLEDGDPLSITWDGTQRLPPFLWNARWWMARAWGMWAQPCSRKGASLAMKAWSLWFWSWTAIQATSFTVRISFPRDSFLNSITPMSSTRRSVLSLMKSNRPATSAVSRHCRRISIPRSAIFSAGCWIAIPLSFRS